MRLGLSRAFVSVWAEIMIVVNCGKGMKRFDNWAETLGCGKGMKRFDNWTETL